MRIVYSTLYLFLSIDDLETPKGRAIMVRPNAYLVFKYQAKLSNFHVYSKSEAIETLNYESL
jgi:hypothetical protein